jgi:UDP-2,3-diacylglucosamine hydrolase
MPRADYIASDVHLGAVPDETERAFVAFLDHVGECGASLLIGGDLFDFWFEYGEIVPGRHFRVLAALSDLVDAGIPVTYAGGNHDAWGGRFLTEQVGLTFHIDPFRMTLGGRPALVAHGDGLGKGDLRYRLLKAVIRSRAAITLFRVLHPELGLRLARAVSGTHAKEEPDAEQRGRAAFIESWARTQMAEHTELALVVCGHSHVPARVEVEPGRWYINTGDWLSHFTYVTIEAEAAPVLRRWPGREAILPADLAVPQSR